MRALGAASAAAAAAAVGSLLAPTAARDATRSAHVGAVLDPLGGPAVAAATAIKPGAELRVLCAGDSITLGTLSNVGGGDGNGYRLRLRDRLSRDRVVFVGTETTDGTMRDGYFAAWPGRAIQYISDKIEPSLQQRPDVILLHAGTNDMYPSGAVSTEGNDSFQAAARLGALIDRIVDRCPDAVLLVAIIINTCKPAQSPPTHVFQSLIPSTVQRRLDSGHRVLAANLTSFPTTELQDCIHPTPKGYRLLGDYWYDLMAQVPRDWIHAPVAHGPGRSLGSRKRVADASIVATSVAVLVGWGLGGF